jgi:hypothetical protein
MAKTNIAQIPAKLYELLEPLDSDERAKVIQATLILFGDAPLASTLNREADDGQNGNANSDEEGSVRDPKSFFELKQPQNKGEELAVAARYRELKEDVHVHNKEELTKVFTDARRNFDSSNYSRDIKNARSQAGFFNKGTGKNSEKLSYFGQNYVDALPNRDAAKKLSRPVKKSSKKKTKSSKTKAKK